MGDTKRTYIPEILGGSEEPGHKNVVYEEELQKISRTRQFVVEVDLINCQNAYSQKLPQWMRHTQEFDNADWVKTGVTVTPDTFVAPDGSMTADTLVFAADDDELHQAGDGSVV